MCLYPRIIQNRRYTKTKKNGGIIPAINDTRVLAVPIGCGRCIECRKQEQRKWQVRLNEDIKDNTNGIFVTLTFSNESIKELNEIINEKEIKYKDEKGKAKKIYLNNNLKGYDRDNEIATIAVRRFNERWRKKHKKAIRHWLVTELGHTGTENIHLHGILYTNESIAEIQEKWKYGIIWAGYENQRSYVNDQTVNYIVKYISKQDKDHKEYKPKILTSDGIGGGYTKRENSRINKYKAGETKEYYKSNTGHKIALPIYYRNKIYTEEEKEKLWLEKLDKKERWICGEKIDISKGEEEYYNALKWHRKKNKKLGYGNNTVDWNRKKYEEERRDIMMKKRINDV